MVARLGLVVVLLVLLGAVTACGIGGDDTEQSVVDRAAGPSSLGEVTVDGESEPASDYDVDDSNMPGAAQISGTGIDRRVIRDAELVLEVSDVNRSVRHARELAGDFGGYTQASSTRMIDANREAAELTLEVPSSDFDAVLDALRDGPYVVRVEHETTSSRDVTEEYVDLQSRLGNLEATELRFVALLDEAGTIEEILSVEREISRIRGEIEQIKGRINYLEQRTDFSRIHVMFYPEEESVTIAGKHFTPVETAREAWAASMQFIGTIGNGIVAVSVFFWWAWPFVIAAGVLLLRYRRHRAISAKTAHGG